MHFALLRAASGGKGNAHGKSEHCRPYGRHLVRGGGRGKGGANRSGRLVRPGKRHTACRLTGIRRSSPLKRISRRRNGLKLSRPFRMQRRSTGKNDRQLRRGVQDRGGVIRSRRAHL